MGLNEPLRPGRHEARLGLEDNERGFRAASRPMPFVVEGSPQAEGSGAGSRLPADSGNLLPWLIFGGIALLLLALLAEIRLGRRQRSD